MRMKSLPDSMFHLLVSLLLLHQLLKMHLLAITGLYVRHVVSAMMGQVTWLNSGMVLQEKDPRKGTMACISTSLWACVKPCRLAASDNCTKV